MDSKARVITPSDETHHAARGLAWVLAAVLAYSLVHAGLRVLASSSLGEEDPLINLAVQQLRLGYVAPRPPLYEWLVWAVQQLTGPGIAGFLIIKYGALTATAGFLYATALRVHGARVWALLTVESLALIYQIAWRYHEGFAHEIPTMAAVAATIWAATRLAQRGGLADYALLGLAIGVGLMSSLLYWAFLATLLIALALQPSLRARLAAPAVLVTLAIALLLVSPYLYWLATLHGPLPAVTRYSDNTLKNLGKGLLDALRGPLFYLSPLIVIVPLMFPRALGIALADIRRPANQAPTPDLAQLVLHQSLAGAALTLLGALAFGMAGYAMHQLMPLYLASVVWVMDVARRAADAEGVQRLRFARFAAAVAVLALSVRVANMFVLDPVCKICRWGMPYDGLAAELVARGLPRSPDAAIVAVDAETGGNLRARLAHGPRVYLAGGGDGLGISRAGLGSRPIAFVWRDRPSDEAAAASLVPALLPPGHGLGEATVVTVPWHHLWRPTGYRASRWHVLVVGGGKS